MTQIFLDFPMWSTPHGRLVFKKETYEISLANYFFLSIYANKSQTSTFKH
jgi:hypothetical protein